MNSSWSTDEASPLSPLLEQLSKYFSNFPVYWFGICLALGGIYFLVGIFLHFYFYVGKRDRPDEWKCQPSKWMSRDLELDEIKLGCLGLLTSGTVASLVITYVVNGGPCTIYWRMDEYTWPWWLLQWPVLFIYQVGTYNPLFASKDYTTYWNHRLYHTTFLYKHFHKLHHRFKQPTAFSLLATHPVEVIHNLVCNFLPIFLIPMHFVPVLGILIYNMYHGLIMHSGVNLNSFWWQPWQADPIFHDNHHQYTHVNFGFDCSLWDRIHGTCRQKDRVYREYLFSGQGKPIAEATREELVEELEERKVEKMDSCWRIGQGREFSEGGKILVENELMKRQSGGAD